MLAARFCLSYWIREQISCRCLDIKEVQAVNFHQILKSTLLQLHLFLSRFFSLTQLSNIELNIKLISVFRKNLLLRKSATEYAVLLL